MATTRSAEAEKLKSDMVWAFLETFSFVALFALMLI